jgi:hypothetical protein
MKTTVLGDSQARDATWGPSISTTAPRGPATASFAPSWQPQPPEPPPRVQTGPDRLNPLRLYTHWARVLKQPKPAKPPLPVL